jgi:hypothetical protein
VTALVRSARATDSPEEAFVEGEPELHPPEEEAVTELEPGDLLEQELEAEQVLEQDIDAQLLGESLEELEEQELEEQEEEETPEVQVLPSLGEEEVEEVGAEEFEAALDEVLAERLAAEEVQGEEPVVGRPHEVEDVDVVQVALRRPDEFACRGCFLLKRRELLADPDHMMCRDCAA